MQCVENVRPELSLLLLLGERVADMRALEDFSVVEGAATPIEVR
tara:strand:- start:428 stop:559 length:132 start_codon:yes stop_codon:yes gene_type:complete